MAAPRTHADRDPSPSPVPAHAGTTNHANDNDGFGAEVPNGQQRVSERINIRVQDQQNNEAVFALRPSSNMTLLIDAYHRLRGVAPNTFRLLFEGVRVAAGQTPQSVYSLALAHSCIEVSVLIASSLGWKITILLKRLLSSPAEAMTRPLDLFFRRSWYPRI